MDDHDLAALEHLSDDELLLQLGKETAGASFVSLNPADLIHKGREALGWVRLHLQPLMCGPTAIKVEDTLTNASVTALMNGFVAPANSFMLSHAMIAIVVVLVIRMGKTRICEGYHPA